MKYIPPQGYPKKAKYVVIRELDPNVVIVGDEVGLAKENTLSKLINALQSVGTDKFLSVPDLATLKQAEFSVVQKYAEVCWGTCPLWVDVGSPVSAGATNTLIDISGAGCCYLVRFFTKYNDMECFIEMDGIRINMGSRERPSYIYTTLGGTGRQGFAELKIYDTTNNKYYIIYHLSNEGIKRFQSSLKVYVHNPDTSTDHKAYVGVNYALLSSPEIRVRDCKIRLSARELRFLLSKLMKMHHRAFTVDIHTEWDDKEKRNIKVLSVLNHTEKEHITKKIREILEKELKIKKEEMEEINY